MRRLVGVAIALLALTSCGHTQRPEGIVERWLESLDQGRAGTPEKYAADDVSEQVLPGFRALDPGHLDAIEVGKGSSPAGAAVAMQSETLVPFRIVTTDGRALAGVATVSIPGTGSALRILTVGLGRSPIPFPSEGGPRIVETSRSKWLAGVGGALVLMAVALVSMALVRRSVSGAVR
jgi:hypothetical protein